MHTVDSQPVRSCDIAIAEQQKVGLNKAILDVSEGTGREFQCRQERAGRFQFYAHHLISRDDAFVGLPILTAPIVIGGATGFIVGDVPCL